MVVVVMVTMTPMDRDEAPVWLMRRPVMLTLVPDDRRLAVELSLNALTTPHRH